MPIIHNFELIQEQQVIEINSIARLYRHTRSGARLLSIINDDENKVFGITFRTPPGNSTGIAHIMEHAVLCGSEKYPLKEPFVELEKGSLRTFLNAFTFPDKTCYPVASQNLQDFYNLIDVYIDAVFHPLIPEHTLQQEGWHFKLDNLDHPLEFSGVVYNEMKGAYSSPEGTITRISRQSLFPDGTYGVDSGGDPREIPDLNYQEFIRFHKEFYHPSNSFIYFFGDDDPDERLRRMDEYLLPFEVKEVDSGIILQPRLNEVSIVRSAYDPGEMEGEDKGYITLNWLIPFEDSFEPVDKTELTLAWSILSHILVGTQASPLRRALVDSQIGEDMIGTGFDGQLQQPYFSTGLKGIKMPPGDENVDPVQVRIAELEDLTYKTLNQLAVNGIDRNTIDASFNTIEFRLRENNTGSFPRGLLIMLRALTSWLYDGDPMSRVMYETPLQSIKAKIDAKERYFERLIEDHILKNEHRSIAVLQPEPGYQEQVEKAEMDRLGQIKDSLRYKELEGIISDNARLKTIQETPDSPQALARIPSLVIDDLEKGVKTIPIAYDSLSGSQVLYHDLFTNGIIYLDLGMNLRLLPPDLMQYMSLYGRCLFEMGTTEEDFVSLTQRIGRLTGGIYPSTFISPVFGNNQGSAWLFLRGKGTLSQGSDLLGLMNDVLMKTQFDNRDRFYQILLEEKAGLESSFIPGGHHYVNSRLRAMFNSSDAISERMDGINYLFTLRDLLQKVESNWEEVRQNLEQIRSYLLNRSAMVANVTLDSSNWVRFRPQLENLLSTIPEKGYTWIDWEATLPRRNEGLTLPSQVNYVGKGANLYKSGYTLDGSIFVINKYLRMTWLWEQIRVKGGAYGGFSSFSHQSGVFTFYSYRDPNVLETLDVYDQTAGYLRQLGTSRLSESELRKSIIGTIGDMDAYQLPDAKGFTSLVRHLVGDTDEKRQVRRDQVLETTVRDFNEFADVLDAASSCSQVVVMGSPETLKNTLNSTGKQFEIVKLM